MADQISEPVQNGARWATEREIEQRQAATEAAMRIGRQVQLALLIANVAGALLTLALFIYFVGLDRELATTVSESFSGPMTSFAVGLLLAILAGLVAFAAHLMRSQMFMDPWEQLDIYVGNNEAAFKAFIARRSASVTWYQRLLAGAGGTLVLSTIAFAAGAMMILGASGKVASKLPPRPAPAMITLPSPAPPVGIQTPQAGIAAPQPYQAPRPVPQTRQP